MLKDSVGVDNWHAYLAEMEQHGRTWGDEATLLAMSVWLDCPSTAPLHASARHGATRHVGMARLPLDCVRLCMQIKCPPRCPPSPQVLFKAEICVISSLSEDYCHVVKPPDVWKVELRTRLYLGHFAEYHYVSTRPVG